MSYLSYTQKMPGVADVFLRDTSLYGPLLHFIEQVMTRPSELTKAEREMIAAEVSKLNGCGFCLGAHRWTLAAMGTDWDTINSLRDGKNGAHLSPKMREMFRFAEQLTLTPESIGRGDVEVLVEAGWSEQAVEDAINVVALFNYVNRLVDALGINNDDVYFERIGKALAANGYAPLLDAAQ